MTTQTRILIAEEDKIIADLLVLKLELLNFFIVGVARDGEETIRIAEELFPDIVLMDVNLKGDLNGIDAAVVLKRSHLLPVVFLADILDYSIILKSWECESYGYMIKSTSDSILNDVIINVLNYHKFENQLKSRVGLHTDAVISHEIIMREMNDENIFKQFQQNQELLFKITDDFIFVLNMEMKIIYVNPRVIDRLNYTNEELYGNSIYKIFHEKLFCVQSGIIDTVSVENCSNMIITGSGVQIPVETIVRPGTWGNKQAKFVIAKELYRLKLPEEKFAKLFHLNPSACGVTDLKSGIYIEVNRAFNTLFGFDKDDVIGKTPVELGMLTFEQRDFLIEKMDSNGNVNNVEIVLNSKTGENRYVLLSSENIYMQEKKYRFTVVHDITERKNMELILLHSREQIREVLENSINASYKRHLKTNSYDYMSPVFSVITGYTPDELKAFPFETIMSFVHPEDRAEIERVVSESFSAVEASSYKLEYRFKHKDGEYRWLLDQFTILRNNDGVPITCIGSVGDITRSKMAEKMMLEKTSLLNSIIETTSDAVFVKNIDGRYILINNSALDFVGMNRADVIGKDDRYIFSASDVEVVMHNDCVVIDEGRVKTFEEYVKVSSGEIFTFLSSKGPVYDSNGKITGTFGIARDITMRKKNEYELELYRDHLEDLIKYRTRELLESEDEIRRLNQNIMNFQEEERQRIARDLHDSVGQIILAAKINIDTYKEDPHRFADRLDIGLNFLIMASQELRDIYMNLYPSILDDHGLEKSVRWLVANMLEPAGLKSVIEINLNPSPPHNICINLYRIIQEIISNVLKHSDAGNFSLSLISDKKTLKLTATDDGKGFGEETGGGITSGCGLSNIRNRVRHLNGSVSIEMNRCPGTSMDIIIEL